MATLLPTFSVTLSQRRWPCVLDPFLALSPCGLPLATQLGQVMELWVVRELWHILDNTCFYRQLSEPRTAPNTDLPYVSRLITFVGDEDLVEEEPPVLNRKALDEWERARTDINMTGLNVFWIGEQLGQSLLPEGIQPTIIKRYEQLAYNLERQPQQTKTLGEPLNAAARDAIALAATLGSAFVLTCQPNSAKPQDAQSMLFRALKSWQIPYQQIDDADPIATIERDYIRHLLVHAGLSSLLWSSDLKLAVLHLSLPAAQSLELSEPDDEIEIDPLNDMDDRIWMQDSGHHQIPSGTNLWAGAQGFWYGI